MKWCHSLYCLIQSKLSDQITCTSSSLSPSLPPSLHIRTSGTRVALFYDNFTFYSVVGIFKMGQLYPQYIIVSRKHLFQPTTNSPLNLFYCPSNLWFQFIQHLACFNHKLWPSFRVKRWQSTDKWNDTVFLVLLLLTSWIGELMSSGVQCWALFLQVQHTFRCMYIYLEPLFVLSHKYYL